MKYAIALGVAFLSFLGTSVAFAASGELTDTGSIFDLAKPILDAVRNGNGFLAAALALVFVTTAARKYGSERFPFLKSKAGGATMNLLMSFGGMVATAIAAGTAPSWALAWTALGVSVTAAGGFQMIKELAVPALRWLEGKAPAWAKPFITPVLSVLLWAFEKRDPVAKAEAAGEAAVKAKPAPGIEGVAGKMRDIP